MAYPSPEAEYFAHLAEGRFMLQRSRGTGGYVFYPRIAEPGTGRADLQWVEASGRGVVYATTVIHQKPPAPAYNVVIVELAEGPRLVSRIEGVPLEDIRIGLQVAARIVRDGDEPVLVFTVDAP